MHWLAYYEIFILWKGIWDRRNVCIWMVLCKLKCVKCTIPVVKLTIYECFHWNLLKLDWVLFTVIKKMAAQKKRKFNTLSWENNFVYRDFIFSVNVVWCVFSPSAKELKSTCMAILFNLMEKYSVKYFSNEYEILTSVVCICLALLFF